MDRQGRVVQGNQNTKTEGSNKESEQNQSKPNEQVKPSETTTEEISQIGDPETLKTGPVNEGKTNTTGLSDEIKAYLHPLHEEWKHGMEIDHKNKLAKKIRKVYCELSSLRRIQMTFATFALVSYFYEC